jgi:hypothetical protein
MANTNHEAMAAAFARIKAAKDSAENKTDYEGSNFKQPEVDYFEFSVTGKYIPFRVLGNPWEARVNPTDCKLVMTSKILSDTGKFYLPVNWKWIMDFRKNKPIADPDWILTRLYNDIMDCEWENPTKEQKEADPNVKSKRIYKHETSSIFKRVKNNQRQGDEYPKGFYPSSRVVMNVRDPLDVAFHEKTKRSKVLCSRVGSKTNEDGSIVYYPEYGMPLSVYDDFIANIVSNAGGHFDFDVASKKDKKTDGTWYYKVQHCSSIEIDPEVRKQLSADPIDTSAWALFDLDELLPVTFYSTLRKVLGGLFQDWDTYAKRDFRDQLEELANHEAEAYKAKLESQKQKDPESTATQHSVKQPEAKVEVPVAAPTVAPKRGERKAAKTEMSDSDRFKKTFWGFDKLPEEERAYFNQIFNGFDAEGKPTWKDKDPDGATLTLVPCKGGKYQPQTLKFCSFCGSNFDESDECGFETPF